MKISGKILLFGEYAILKGGDALAIPLDAYGGELCFDFNLKQESSNSSIKLLFSYLKVISGDLNSLKLNLDQLNNDINRGLWFNSNIPLKSGLGSSGAVVASIASKYGISLKDDVNLLKADLALMESFFHGNSSGIDPLVSYLNKSVLIKNGSVEISDYKPNMEDIKLIPVEGSGDTGKLVSVFLKSMTEESYSKMFYSEYIPLQNDIIALLLDGSFKSVQNKLRKLSDLQLSLFKTMIPEQIIPMWEKGLESKDYVLKLCGSGGGGFALRFSF